MFTVTWELARTHRVAIAGLGGVVQGLHLPAYRALGAQLGIEIVGGADPDEERRSQVAADADFPIFASVAEMLEAVSPEVMDVAVPPGEAKIEVIQQSLEAGCHVLAQKPFTRDMGQAQELVATARKADRLIAINVQARFAPAFRAVAELVAEGALGEVRSGAIGSSFPLGGDTTVDMGIHELDLLRFWTGLDPREVRATVRPLFDGRARVIIDVDFGSAVGLIVEDNHFPVSRPWTFQVAGTEGIVEGREQFGTTEPAEVVLHRPDTGSRVVELGYSYVPDACAHVMASLLDAIERGTEPPTSAASHLPSLAGVLAAHRSVESGRSELVESDGGATRPSAR